MLRRVNLLSSGRSVNLPDPWWLLPVEGLVHFEAWTVYLKPGLDGTAPSPLASVGTMPLFLQGFGGHSCYRQARSTLPLELS